MAQVELSFAERVGDITCEALRGHERLGEAVDFELEVVSAEPIEAARVLRKPCAIRIAAGSSARTIHGVVTRITSFAAPRAESARRHRLTVRSPLALLEHRQRSRVFQHLSVPDIVRRVLVDGGYGAGAVRVALQEPHEVRPYVVQYGESDATFVRRLCEEEGLYFRFEAGDDGEEVVLEDTSAAAPPALDASLPVVDDSMLASRHVVAFGCSVARQRRPGRVVVRRYDHEHPALRWKRPPSPEAASRSIEVYASPASTALRGDSADGAALVLESLRAEAVHGVLPDDRPAAGARALGRPRVRGSGSPGPRARRGSI